MTRILQSAISGPQARNSHAQVVNEIGRGIVAGDFPENSLLPGDADLVDRFGVSRTVLREAMKTLGAKGMIVARARIGTRVTERRSWNLFDADILTWHFEAGLDGELFRHLSDMRLVFEPAAGRMAARNASAEVTQSLFDHTEDMAHAESAEDFVLADLNFHMALLEASGNPFMLSLGNVIEAALSASLHNTVPDDIETRRDGVAKAHRAIAQAIHDKDENAAASAIEAVITAGRDRISGVIAE